MKKTQGIWIIAVLFIAITTFGIGTQKTTRTTTSNSTNTSTKTLKRYDRNDHWGAWCGSVVSAFGRMATNNFDKKFNYNRITDAPKPTDTLINDVYIERNQRGIITRISDGKSPLMLGSIPSQETNIQKLRDEFGLSDVAIIKVYTLNRPFERNWSGLAKLVKNNPKKLKAFTYVTTDSGPPAFIDLVKAVYDLEHRDATPHTLAYVHCKAGKGRSAVTVAAYLAHLGNKAGITLTPQEIKQFLVSKRPVVRFNDYHQKGLEQFCEELQKAGSLEALCTEYPEALL